jgi:hypothetical protein
LSECLLEEELRSSTSSSHIYSLQPGARCRLYNAVSHGRAQHGEMCSFSGPDNKKHAVKNINATRSREHLEENKPRVES